MNEVARYISTNCKCGPQRIPMQEFVYGYRQAVAALGPNPDGVGISCGMCQQSLLRIIGKTLYVYNAKVRKPSASEGLPEDIRG